MSSKAITRSFGEWEVEYDETLIYPSLSLLNKKPVGSKYSSNIKVAPKIWRRKDSHSLSPLSRSNQQNVSTLKIPISTLLSTTVSEEYYKNKLREDLLKLQSHRNRFLLPSQGLDLAKVSTAALKYSREPHYVKPANTDASPLELVLRRPLFFVYMCIYKFI
jgi:hypothetical protein